MNDNPKYVRAQKEGKAPLERLVGGKVDEEEARVLAHGAEKYGKFNWRQDPILASTYVGAIRRHLNAWAAGEDLDPDSGIRHLAHIRACCAVAMDAEIHGTMIDDRFVIESKKQKEGIPVEDLTKWDGLVDGDVFEWDAYGIREQRSVVGGQVRDTSGMWQGSPDDSFYQRTFVRYVRKAPR